MERRHLLAQDETSDLKPHVAPSPPLSLVVAFQPVSEDAIPPLFKNTVIPSVGVDILRAAPHSS